MNKDELKNFNININSLKKGDFITMAVAPPSDCGSIDKYMDHMQRNAACVAKSITVGGYLSYLSYCEVNNVAI